MISFGAQVSTPRRTSLYYHHLQVVSALRVVVLQNISDTLTQSLQTAPWVSTRGLTVISSNLLDVTFFSEETQGIYFSA